MSQPKQYKYHVKGNLASSEAIIIKDEVLRLITDGYCKIVLDLRETKDADVVGINAIVAIHRKIKDINGTLEILVRPESASANMLSITKFDKWINIHT